MPRHPIRPLPGYVRSGGLIAAVLLLAACQQEKAPAPAQAPSHPPAAASAPAPQASSSAPRSRPDFGGVGSEHVEVSANGATLAAAIDQAIRLAVQQVNGQVVSGGSASLDTGGSLTVTGQPMDYHSQAYADWLVSRTAGVVTHFRIVSQRQISRPRVTDEERLKASQDASWNKGKFDASEEASASYQASADASAEARADGVGSSRAQLDADVSADGHYEGEASGQWDVHQGASKVDYQHKHTEFDTEWQVKIAADVAVYHASADSKLTRVVIAMPHAGQAQFQVGDRTIAADEVGRRIKGELTDALTQTHRFTILDRDDEADIAQEVDLIQSGATTREDVARLGQRLAADLLVIPSIERFEYLRHERRLRLADRTLVSYTGGGRLSFRVVNTATGQIAMSQSFDYALPPSAPTTLGASPDGEALAHAMMESLDRNIVAAILRSTFPLSVVQANGPDVVINQGGEAVQVGTSYQAVFLGKDVIDPQSGQSLGPTETPCCTITIDRVTPKLSYGHIVEAGVNLGASFKPGSVELRDPVARRPQATQAVAAIKRRPAAHERAMPKAGASGDAAASSDDGNW